MNLFDLMNPFALLLDAQDPAHFLTDGQPVGFHPKLPLDVPGGWWLSTVLFLSFTMLVIIRVFDNRRLVQLLGGFVRSTSLSLFYREEYALTGRVSVLLLLNFLIVSPLFIWQVIANSGISLEHPWLMYPILSVGIALVYLVKILSTRLLGFVFELRESATEYVYTILLFNKTIGLILFPLVVLLAFGRGISPDILIWTGLILWGIVLIYRFFRCVLIGIGTGGLSFMYFLLYLCTLEILPFIVIFKVFVGKI